MSRRSPAGSRRSRRLRCAAVHQPHPDARRDAADSLAISRTVSIGRGRSGPGRPARPSRPGWSPRAASPPTTWPSDGLGIRRAEVVGQLLPGLVSVFRPVRGRPPRRRHPLRGVRRQRRRRHHPGRCRRPASRTGRCSPARARLRPLGADRPTAATSERRCPDDSPSDGLAWGHGSTDGRLRRPRRPPGAGLRHRPADARSRSPPTESNRGDHGVARPPTVRMCWW